MEGGPNRPPFCVLDNDNTEPTALHASLEARIVAEIELTLGHMGYEIVRVRCSAGSARPCRSWPTGRMAR